MLVQKFLRIEKKEEMDEQSRALCYCYPLGCRCVMVPQQLFQPCDACKLIVPRKNCRDEAPKLKCCTNCISNNMNMHTGYVLSQGGLLTIS